MIIEDFINAFNRPFVLTNKINEPFPNAISPAAVLICIYQHKGEFFVLFTERAEHLKHHAGQISFPGGKAEEHDIDLVATAYREAEEEVGLNSQHLKLIGRMHPYRTVSGFAVTPIISVYGQSLNIESDLVLDKNEVANAFGVPLAYLMEGKNYSEQIIHRNNKQFPVYFLPYQSRLIWGATAGMLSILRDHVTL